MLKYTVEVSGMMCGGCEKRTNEALEGAFPVKDVQSFHDKNKTVFKAENEIDEKKLRDAIEALGFKVGAIKKRRSILG